MIRVGLECSSSLTRNPTGVQRYINGVLSGLQRVEGVSPTRLFKASRWRKRVYLPKCQTASRWYGPALGLIGGPYDVIHCMDPTLPWVSLRAPLIVTIHDAYLALHAEDISYKKQKEKLLKLKSACARAAHIVVPTEAIKKELSNLFDTSAKISAIPHGVSQDFFNDEKFFRPAWLPSAPFIVAFCGGTRKNLLRVIKAFSASRLFTEGWYILIVGKPDDQEIAEMRETGFDGRFRILDKIPDNELVALYQNCDGVCYPSLYEGFGFPVLEAMAARVPVVTSGTGATKEVAGSCALFVDPTEEEDILRALNKIPEINEKSLDVARKHAANFTWDKVGLKLEEIYRAFV